MAEYMEMVNAQLCLLKKQFILILNSHFNAIYRSRIKGKWFAAKYTQTKISVV